MVVSNRAVATVGLGLLGLGLLVGPSLGQQQDAAVRKSATQSAPPATALPPVSFGTIDMTDVFKKYDKVKVSGEEFKAAVLAKKGELMKAMEEMQQEQNMLQKFTPNSVDYKKHEDRITQLKAESEAKREQAEREFSLREAEMLATLYKEIQSMVTRVAKQRQLTYVLKVSNEPITGADPNSAMRAIERSVVYADTKNDITADVVKYLNYEYHAAGGPVPKAASTANAASSTIKR